MRTVAREGEHHEPRSLMTLVQRRQLAIVLRGGETPYPELLGEPLQGRLGCTVTQRSGGREPAAHPHLGSGFRVKIEGSRAGSTPCPSSLISMRR